MIRRVEPEDVPALSAIERASFAVPWTSDMLLGLCVPPNIGLLDEENGEPTGYIGLDAVADTGEILTLAVKEEARRRGVATRLIRAGERRLRTLGVKEIFLEVRLSNLAAQALYEKEGFVPVGRRKNYYVLPREDALICRKELK